MLADEWCHSAWSLNHPAAPVLAIIPMHIPLGDTAGLLMWVRQTHQDSPLDSPSLAFVGVWVVEREGRAMMSSGSLCCTSSATCPGWMCLAPRCPWDVNGGMPSAAGHVILLQHCPCQQVFWEPMLAVRRIATAL